VPELRQAPSLLIRETDAAAEFPSEKPILFFQVSVRSLLMASDPGGNPRGN
jgi:hypothetical protein